MRGEATRLALIRAAIEVFGREGYKAATTSEIARTADANQALISYYYGGKEGLYRAVVEHISRRIDARTEPMADRVDALLREIDSGRVERSARERRCLELLFAILDACAEFFLTDAESAAWARIMLHEQREPTEAFETLYVSERRLLDVIAQLVAAMRGVARIAAQDRLVVLAILGEALVFRSARATAFRYLGWGESGAEHVAEIKQSLRRHAAALLGVGRAAEG
ncbi:MAG TPA: CerR family C-terminal domain-containing protein [Gammaproteobacteria bacterium]|nr:CerR family C-terminal domain-containing protein [Gammaproteobacteria bacterium]